MNDKEEIIKEAYEKDFGTAYDTYTTAITRNPSIRLQDVNDYFDKRDDIQGTIKHTTYISFVSPGKDYEYEVDIVDVLARYGGDGIIYGLCAIDNFTKNMASVIPTNNRTPSEIEFNI